MPTWLETMEVRIQDLALPVPFLPNLCEATPSSSPWFWGGFFQFSHVAIHGFPRNWSTEGPKIIASSLRCAWPWLTGAWDCSPTARRAPGWRLLCLQELEGSWLTVATHFFTT